MRNDQSRGEQVKKCQVTSICTEYEFVMEKVTARKNARKKGKKKERKKKERPKEKEREREKHFFQMNRLKSCCSKIEMCP